MCFQSIINAAVDSVDSLIMFTTELNKTFFSIKSLIEVTSKEQILL